VVLAMVVMLVEYGNMQMKMVFLMSVVKNTNLKILLAVFALIFKFAKLAGGLLRKLDRLETAKQ
jgi:hypothetical protein